MSNKIWANAFSMIFMLGMLVSPIQPVTTLAAPAPQGTGPYTTPNGFVISKPVAPADNSKLPIPGPVTPYGKESADRNSNFPLPKASKATIEGFADTVLQSQPGLPNTPAKINDFEGIGNISGVLPPDTDGQVGPNDYVQLINATNVGIYNKTTGTLKYPIFSLGGLWPAGDPCSGNDGDPVVLYDQMADRWILTQFNFPNYPSGNYYECFAISKTGEPTDIPADWWAYSFAVHTTKMNDYPKIGIWPDGYYMTVNQFISGSAWGGAGVFVFDRLKMIAGQAATFQYFDLYSVNSSYGGMLPSSLMGASLPPAGAPNYFVEVDQDWSGTNDILHVFAFHVDWDVPANTTFQLKKELVVASYQMLCPNNRACIDQPGYANSLDAIGDRLMMHAWYRNFGSYENMLFNHTVDAGSGTAGVRWYEIRKSVPAADGWDIYQQGTFSPDSHNRWMGSIAMDLVGNIALGYSISSDTIYPSVRYAGRLAADPLGTLGNERSIIDGNGAQTHSAARWGDYSAMSVDPVDDCTFWYTQEYIPATASAGWHTRIGFFKFPSCSPGPTGSLEGTVKNAVNNASIEGANVVAAGLLITQTGSTVTGADGQYSMPLPVSVYQVQASAFGFQSSSVRGVTVYKDTVTTRNFSLNPAPKHQVSGKVTDTKTGWPLYAHITISGNPINPPAPDDSVWTDPVTGDYSITLPEGITYNFHTVAFVPGYLPKDVNIGQLTAGKGANIQLDVDPVSCNAPGYHLTGGTCPAPSGGLVVGNVYDANTGEGKNRAVISYDSGYATSSLATPGDTAVSDGFYTLFSPADIHNFTAALNNYQTGSANVTVIANSTVRHDFQLQAGKLTFTPQALSATLQLGQGTTRMLTVGNTGNANAAYHFIELDKEATPLGPIEQRTSLMPREWRRDFPDTLHNGMTYTPPVAPPYAAGDVIQSWDPGHFPWGITYDLVNKTIWVDSPSSSWSGDDHVYEFQTDGTATGRAYPNASTHTDGPADMATNWNTGMMWIMNVNTGVANCIYEIDPASGYTGNSICPGGGTGFNLSQRGLAYDPTTDSWFAGGWNDQMVHHFTADGTILDSVNVGLPISGLAYNPDTHHLFALINGATPTVYVLDTANTYEIIGQFNIDGLVGGAGLEIDCDGNLWAADQANNLVFQVETGEPALFCAQDIPWLSESPADGALTAHTSANINVAFDAGIPEITQPGEYHTLLAVQNNTPYGKGQVPVTMTVSAPASYGKIKGTVTGLSYCDADPTPFKKAVVHIQGGGGFTQILNTDPSGYYQFWLDQSHSPLVIDISYPGYKTVHFTGVSLVGGQTITRDASLRWLEPCAKVDPDMLSIEVGRGYSLSLPEKLMNQGAANTIFNLYEIQASLGQRPVKMPEKATLSPRRLDLSLSNQVPAGPANPWTPHGPASLILDDGSAETSIGFTGGWQFVWLNRFTTAPTDFPFVLTEISALFPANTTAGDDIELLVYWDADGNPANGATFLYSEYVQVQHNDWTTWNIYQLANPVLITEPGDVLIGMVNRSGTADYEDFPATIDTSSTRQRSWIGFNNGGYPSDPPVLPADNFDLIDNYGFSGNWILRGSGYTGLLDIPWLSESPIAGTINADNSQTTQVTFTALMTMAKGTYDGILKVKTEDPVNPIIDIPVQMIVADPGYGVTLSPDMAQSGVPGSTITYDIVLTNNSNGPTDSFDLTFGSHAWSTELLTPATVGPMEPGETKTVKVAVHVPDDARNTDSDIVTLEATSKHDNTIRDFIDLISSVTGNYSIKISLPFTTNHFTP